MLGTVNSVNLTDGLDGLASGVTLIVSMTMSIIAAFATHAMEQDGLVYIADNYKLLFSLLPDWCLSWFLRFNGHPAKFLWVTLVQWP